MKACGFFLSGQSVRINQWQRLNCPDLQCTVSLIVEVTATSNHNAIFVFTVGMEQLIWYFYVRYTRHNGIDCFIYGSSTHFIMQHHPAAP